MEAKLRHSSEKEAMCWGVGGVRVGDERKKKQKKFKKKIYNLKGHNFH